MAECEVLATGTREESLKLSLHPTCKAWSHKALDLSASIIKSLSAQHVYLYTQEPSSPHPGGFNQGFCLGRPKGPWANLLAGVLHSPPWDSLGLLMQM